MTAFGQWAGSQTVVFGARFARNPGDSVADRVMSGGFSHQNRLSGCFCHLGELRWRVAILVAAVIARPSEPPNVGRKHDRDRQDED